MIPREQDSRYDTYGEPIVMNIGIHTVTVYHPILSPEERARREQVIIKAAEALLLERELKLLEKQEAAAREA